MFTGKPLLELKSLSSKKKGELCEKKVLKYFLNKNFKLINKNKKIGGIEIDLIFYKKHYIMVEVKSLSSLDQISFRLKKTQQNRLLRAQELLQSYKKTPVQLIIAFVPEDKDIIFIDISDSF